MKKSKLQIKGVLLFFLIFSFRQGGAILIKGGAKNPIHGAIIYILESEQLSIESSSDATSTMNANDSSIGGNDASINNRISIFINRNSYFINRNSNFINRKCNFINPICIIINRLVEKSLKIKKCPK
ncbi:MAG: hypothetical protein K0S51_1155 [Bacillales bacterium]|nr:hypothetical protein [Bacillales bacterium]